MVYVVYFILIAVAIFFVNKFLKRFKIAKVGSMALVNGGVKCGKSTFSVYLAIREFKSRVRFTKFKNFFRKLFKKELIELPLLYSNVPLALPYVPLTDELLTRKERFVYNSVIYCQEASLVADSQLLKNMELNEQLLLFNKLIGHETKGGCLIYDTQCISDLHYSIKRCLSNYFYIHHLTKWIPFFLIAEIQECRYSEDGSVITTNTEDVENLTRKVIIPKSTWRKFDCYCYSVLTDDLPVNTNVVKNDKNTIDLKAREIISFRNNFKSLKAKTKEVVNNDKEKN